MIAHHTKNIGESGESGESGEQADLYGGPPPVKSAGKVGRLGTISYSPEFPNHQRPLAARGKGPGGINDERRPRPPGIQARVSARGRATRPLIIPAAFTLSLSTAGPGYLRFWMPQALRV